MPTSCDAPIMTSHRTRLRPALVGVALLAMAATGCSDEALGDLGGRSSDWIGEVATTATTTTTLMPSQTRPATAVDWHNDELGEPDPEATPEEVLAAVFARAGDSSQYLQASRAEIAAAVPEVAFPATVPASVGYITSQLVIESRVLRLSAEPTVAFGLWSVEPYTRSRSVGQVVVLNVSTDPNGAEVAADPNTEATCAAFTTENRVCGVEDFLDHPVWRLEGEGGVTHLWYENQFRYELAGRVNEEVIHEVIASMTSLAELLPDG
jgi:hypothetical protein